MNFCRCLMFLVVARFVWQGCASDRYGYVSQSAFTQPVSIACFLFLFFIAPIWVVTELDNYYTTK